MSKRSDFRLRIFSNFKRYDELLKDEPDVQHVYTGGDESSFFSMIKSTWQALWNADALIINNHHQRMYIACAMFLFALRPFRRCKLVSVDLLLRPEKKNGWGRVKTIIKSFLLKQTDVFLLYFKDWSGYTGEYRLPGHRMRYVPFKVNSWEILSREVDTATDEHYVLCAGQTYRDHDTFIEAMRLAQVPGLLLLPKHARKQPEIIKNVPPNLAVHYHDDGKEETYLSYFKKARIVCVPRFAWDYTATGISAYLCAMGLKKCVAVSRGPGADDVLEEANAAEFFPPENPQELAKVLKNLWSNDSRRHQLALNGMRYAAQLQGEDRLLKDVLIETRSIVTEAQPTLLRLFAGDKAVK